jgi:TetR/AcrR family transcriptional regulator, lmrAB and yxaGH operons repressor
MSSARDQILEITCDLFESQGFHATGLNQVVKESGAPKGSLYYYFPEGKEEIAAEAIKRTGLLVQERIRANLANNDAASEAVRQFILTIAHHVELSGFQAGGPLMMVAMETATSSERINVACREAYQHLQDAFRDRLVAGGYTAERAAQLAMFITSSIEGGIILSRTYHSGAPLRRVAEELARFLNANQ